ncbi:hypothetical protein KFL_003770010 [Klebsormidium nitens]|uniref:Uncharacterized protein n=1 Tax=Klebsormidium nitens TaxID=105231 RepID=A0A1Y1IFD5_KLENI|nr:hypothetical protein KFL_003770010 [Klebsormidium nitens]|eukprot:GAQ87781.1 hypothetical protein KFL_003770010 [Klebsormidium nitens]
MEEEIKRINDQIAEVDAEIKDVGQQIATAEKAWRSLEDGRDKDTWLKREEDLRVRERQLREEKHQLREEKRDKEALLRRNSLAAVHCVVKWEGEDLPTVVEPVAHTPIEILHAFCEARLVKSAGLKPLDLILTDQKGQELTNGSPIPTSTAATPLRVVLRNETAFSERSSHCSASSITPHTLRVAEAAIGWTQKCSNWPVKLPNPIPTVLRYEPKALRGKKKSDEAANTP